MNTKYNVLINIVTNFGMTTNVLEFDTEQQADIAIKTMTVNFNSSKGTPRDVLVSKLY